MVDFKALRLGSAPHHFRSRVVDVQAILWTGTNALKVMEWASGFPAMLKFSGETVEVKTANGWVEAEPGDWLIMEPSGEGLYPCKPEVFEKKYEEVGPVTRGPARDPEFPKPDPLVDPDGKL